MCEIVKVILLNAVARLASFAKFCKITDPLPGLLCRCAPRNDGNRRHCERSEAIQELVAVCLNPSLRTK